MASLQIFTVDAFSHDQRAFTGNPAAVCLIPANLKLDTTVLQNIATEMNLADTAFVQCVLPSEVKVEHNGRTEYQKLSLFNLRWFTPTTEVRLCGHATLAAAHVLFNDFNNPFPELRFQTLSGTIRASRDPQPSADRVALLLPRDMPRPLRGHHQDRGDDSDDDGSKEGADGYFPPEDRPPAYNNDHPSSGLRLAVSRRSSQRPLTPERRSKLQQVIDLVLQSTRQNLPTGSPHTVAVRSVHYSAARGHLIVHLRGGPEALQRLTPLFPPVVLNLGHECKLTMMAFTTVATTRSEKPVGADTELAVCGADCAVRVFCPWVGVYEDTVTGSAYSTLAPYWSHVLGKPELVFIQGGKRFGKVFTLLNPEFDDLVQISGSAVTVLSGRFQL
ncbi:hypothetical protein IWQ60_008833 [Tieghemiomyces parasiticus]|uniref:Uncharacterized protein n=1 Tax=Tieghemiomyces parasiticus TaxID=78921 RepID=A0A9W7ZRA5_9FUNG|nr:hypothetical protein IWQ60_008833 [Tieghemiomyces parasiticus]